MSLRLVCVCAIAFSKHVIVADAQVTGCCVLGLKFAFQISMLKPALESLQPVRLIDARWNNDFGCLHKKSILTCGCLR